MGLCIVSLETERNFSYIDIQAQNKLDQLCAHLYIKGNIFIYLYLAMTTKKF